MSPSLTPVALLGQRVARALAIATVATGVLVLLGWFLDLPALANPLPGVAMKANTAACFVALGVSLFLRTAADRHWRHSPLGAVLALAVALLAALTLVEYALGVDAGIDEALLTEPPGVVGTLPPGRMAPNTALAFLLEAVALLGSARRRPGPVHAAQHASLAAGFIALLTLLGFLFHPHLNVDTPAYQQMALLTAGAFLALSAGVVSLHPDLGVAAVVARSGPGGRMARRLLPAALLVPAVLGWLRLRGEEAGLYDTGFGVALTVVFTLAGFSVFVVWTAASLNESEDARAAMEAQRLRALEELRAAKEAAEATSRELEAFSYSVSHDLRAPLRAIDGFSQALVEDEGPALSPGARGHLGRVRAAAQRMGHVIDELLALSRLSRAELSVSRVDLSALARELASTLAADAPGREVQVRIAPGLVARCDGRLMAIALENLLRNAWKFTAKRPQATIEVGRTEVGGEPALFVRDDGVGFDMAYADKLFGPFQRLHRAEDFEGTGIGLVTVQRIIHRHGGRVWAEGRPGEGATFSFTLGPGGLQ